MTRLKTFMIPLAALLLLVAGAALILPQQAVALSCGIPGDLPSGCRYQYSHVPCSGCGAGFYGVRKVAGPAGCPIYMCVDF
jgi:hypothetical protein